MRRNMKRKNADDRLRAIERAVAAGDPQAAKQLHVERRRAGMPLLPDKMHRSKRWATESFYFPNGRGVLVASVLESAMTPDETVRLEREGRPGRYAQIEWDPNFWGGDYDDVGNFAYLELERPYVDSRGLFAVDRLTDENVEERFEKLTGASRENIIHYTLDEAYAKDEDGDFMEEDLVDDGIAYVSMGDDKGTAPLGLSYQWPAIRIHGSQVGRAHLDPQVQALVADVLDMPQWSPDAVRTQANPRKRRNMADDQFRALERAYLASPADAGLLGQLLRTAARSRGGAPGAITWIDTFWHNNGLTPDHADLDVLADAAFESSSYSEDLRQNLEAVERIALAADASDLQDVHEDDRDQDQRAPWWRRERFHDLDFDRSHPHKGGRLYSPASSSVVKVSEVTLDRGAGKRPGHRGWLLVERPIERPVYGVDAVLVDMAQGPITQRRPISTWLLRRVLGAAANAATSLVRPFRHAVFVTDMRDDPTDVVEQIAGAPAAPLGGAPRTYTGRGPMTGLWEGALGRAGRVEVMRAAGPSMSSLLTTALYQWRVAEHPYRVRLDELRSTYHEERGGESMALIWVGRGKNRSDIDGVTIASWNNDQTDPVAEEFEWGEPIYQQIDLDDQPQDWTEPAAHYLHQGETIVVEEWEEQPEREGPYAIGNLFVAGVTCNERFSTRNEGEIVVGGDQGDVRAESAVNTTGGVMLYNARLVTTQTGLTDDQAASLAVDIIMSSWNSVGEDTFNQARRRQNRR